MYILAIIVTRLAFRKMRQDASKRAATTWEPSGEAMRETGCAAFEVYCQHKWGWNRNRAYTLIAAAETAECVQLDTKPTNEAQARPLSKLPKESRADIGRRYLGKFPR